MMRQIGVTADQIKWTVTWLGVGAVGLGVALMLIPYNDFHTTAYAHMHQLTASQWGVLWVSVGVLIVATANLAWPIALWPLCILVILMMVWAVLFLAAAIDHQGHGLIGAIVWAWFGGTVWFAALRAARTPHLVKSVE
jgi:hypothetical protein